MATPPFCYTLASVLDYEYAGMVRPAIDRAYAGMRFGGRSHVVEVLDSAGIRPGFLLDFYFGLLARPMPPDGFAAATTYRDPDMDLVLEHGLAVHDGDGSWRLTDAGRDFALRILNAVGAGADEVWGRKPLGTLPWAEPLPRLAELLGRLLEAGAASAGPAFRALAPPYEPTDSSPASVAASRMGALRHHRADAHRAAWAAAGLTVDELLALPADDPRRRAVEDDTNRRDAPIYSALSEPERLEFLALLAALPS